MTGWPKNAYLTSAHGSKAGAFLQTFMEYPPSQRPASFAIDQIRPRSRLDIRAKQQAAAPAQ